VRTTRWALFGLLAVTVAGVVALFITSTIDRGPAHNFELVPQGAATPGELRTDAAAMVRRLEAVGYSTTEAQVVGQSIQLTMYGSASGTREALTGAIVQARMLVRPVECAAPAYQVESAESQLTAPRLQCAPAYGLTAADLQVDTMTGLPGKDIGPDPGLAGIEDTRPAEDFASRTVILPAGPNSGFSGERLVLGPSSFDNSDIASANAQAEGGYWAIEIALTSKGSQEFDSLSQRQFHAYIAFDLDSTLVSVPLVQPTQSTYSTSSGTFEFATGHDEAETTAIADDLTSPLATPLVLKG
jgi:hypothetical protein